MKTILFLYNGRLSYLPPFQALIDSLLCDGNYKIVVISSEAEPEIDKLYKDKNIEFIHYYNLEPRLGFLSRLRNKYRTKYIFKHRIKKEISNIKYDILWVIHERTGVLIKDTLKGRKYILSIYELNDKKNKLREQLKQVARNAAVTVICEQNRAWIMRVWYNLTNPTVVLPNKPFSHPRKKNVECSIPFDEHKKIILYQGNVSRDRNLNAFCEAINELEGFELVLMGLSDPDYLKELTDKYNNVRYVGYIKSPFHLNVTSHAYIGIVTYDPGSLNRVYCAPNKIWEYSGFGVPMIANEIPGLTETVGRSESGLCTDTDSSDDIKDAIRKIDQNYDYYEKKALEFYDSCDLSKLIDKVIQSY